MTDMIIPPSTFSGPKRQDGAKAVRPRRAATLILIRRDGSRPRVLMGKRNGGHKFMPNLWVFPGGRVDPADSRAPHGGGLNPELAGIFAGYRASGRALALAAIRETFEEAGLLLAQPALVRPAAGPWRDFLAQGALPDLQPLDLVARAITPPMISKRFDTWFFTADAERLMSLERQPDCGELEEIAWFDAEQAADLKLPAVTRTMMGEAFARLDDKSRPRLFMRYRRGAQRLGHL